MTFKCHFFCLLSVVSLAAHVLVASPVTRLQARKRELFENRASGEQRVGQNPLVSSHPQVNILEQSLLEAAAHARKRDVSKVIVSEAHDGDQQIVPEIKRVSPETPKIQALSLEQASYSMIPIMSGEADGSKRVKPDFEAILREEQSLKGLVLAEDDVEDLSAGDARWLVHMSIRQDYSDKESLSLLTEKCSLGAVRDLIIEASMANRVSIVHLLVARAQELDREQGLSVNKSNDLSTASYDAMAIGYYVAEHQQSLNEKDCVAAAGEGKKNELSAKLYNEAIVDWFKQVCSTDVFFREAVKRVRSLHSTQSF